MLQQARGERHGQHGVPEPGHGPGGEEEPEVPGPHLTGTGRNTRPTGRAGDAWDAWDAFSDLAGLATDTRAGSAGHAGYTCTGPPLPEWSAGPLPRPYPGPGLRAQAPARSQAGVGAGGDGCAGAVEAVVRVLGSACLLRHRRRPLPGRVRQRAVAAGAPSAPAVTAAVGSCHGPLTTPEGFSAPGPARHASAGRPNSG
ncbi:hypothetical protein GCM10018783_10030 [Streptomyces griseosporeus]|nr:hypothetical protein GCM10018783_10030 [Streptomyces griseosporeus]